MDASGVKTRGVKSHAPDHRDGAHHLHENEKYYHTVAEELANATEILVVGPGPARTHFKAHLDHHHPALAKKVLAVEAMDHPTDNQILAHARKFFKHAHLFN